MKGLKSSRPLLGQAALVQLQLGPHDDDRTAGVVDPLCRGGSAGSAPACPSGVSESDFSGRFVGAAEHATPPPVVEEGVDRLLEHALLVAHDHVGAGARSAS